jgi:hypothetical protein
MRSPCPKLKPYIIKNWKVLLLAALEIALTCYVAYTLFMGKFSGDENHTSVNLIDRDSKTGIQLFKCRADPGYLVFRNTCEGVEFTSSWVSFTIYIIISVASPITMIYAVSRAAEERESLDLSDLQSSLQYVKVIASVKTLTLYNYLNFASEPKIGGEDDFIEFTYAKAEIWMVAGTLAISVIMMIAIVHFSPMKAILNSVFTVKGTWKQYFGIVSTLTLVVFSFLNYVGIANASSSSVVDVFELRGPDILRVTLTQYFMYYATFVQYTLACKQMYSLREGSDGRQLDDLELK